jgi:hypothetical protein
MNLSCGVLTGPELVSALAKLAVSEQAVVLQATASSHLSYRLARLSRASPNDLPSGKPAIDITVRHSHRRGIFQTIAHTACCFAIKH